MELKEALVVARMMNNHFRAFQKIEEVLVSIDRLVSLAQEKEKVLSDIDTKIKAAYKEKTELDESLKIQNQEFLKRMASEEAKMLADARNKANIETQRVLTSMQTEHDALLAKNKELNGALVELDALLSSETVRVNSEIKTLSDKKATLESEIVSLTEFKTNLELEITALKQKLSGLFA